MIFQREGDRRDASPVIIVAKIMRTLKDSHIKTKIVSKHTRNKQHVWDAVVVQQVKVSSRNQDNYSRKRSDEATHLVDLIYNLNFQESIIIF